MPDDLDEARAAQFAVGIVCGGALEMIVGVDAVRERRDVNRD